MVFGGASMTSTYEKITLSTFIPSHTSIIIHISLYSFDSWNDNDLILSVDGVSDQYVYKFTTPASGINYCITPIFDQVTNVEAVFNSHSTASLKFNIENQVLNPKLFGFKNIEIFYENACPFPCATCIGSDCITCPFFSVLITVVSPKTCECVEGFYMEQSDYFRCIQCHFSCKTCNGPGINQCTSCLGLMQYDILTHLCNLANVG